LTGGAGGIAGTAGFDSGLPPPDGGCAYAAVESTLLPANMLVVLDRSGSMNCNLPPITQSADCEANPVQVDTTQPKKWEVVVGALKDAFVALPPSASVGLAFFNNNDVCGVNSTPSVGVNLLEPTQIAALGNALDSVPVPKGGTPIVGATIVAYKHLHEQALLEGNKFVVLITDGKETCDPDKVQILQTEIPKAVSVNIRTFVIGAPGSEPARALLSAMAYLGGTARSPTCDHSGAVADQGDCHFDMTTTQDFAADLAAGLAAISGQALGCELDVPAAGPNGQPVDYNKVNVRYARAGDVNDIVDILQDPDRPCDGGAEGWQYAQDNRKIVLCGSICDDVKGDEKARVEVVLGCETAVVK
jgi:hypothetical protein